MSDEEVKKKMMSEFIDDASGVNSTTDYADFYDNLADLMIRKGWRKV